jgi:hypothetical protein
MTTRFRDLTVGDCFKLPDSELIYTKMGKTTVESYCTETKRCWVSYYNDQNQIVTPATLVNVE